jgi:uncharacterized membrane protein YgaE (UPF0421/DUF939 family)
VFSELARYLRNPDRVWAGGELLATEAAVEEGMAVAKRARENRLLPQTEPWQLYFHMRRQQLDQVQSMMELVALVSERVPQGHDIAGLFERLADDVRSDFYEGQTESGLDVLERQFKHMPLPATRDEFETRAALLQLCRELRTYLSIAKREKKRRSSSPQSVIE